MTFQKNKQLIIVGGPTASGKTSVGIALAKHFGSEIISADSRQIYKETCIGTAVPEKEELAAVPHHFIQTISLEDYYNASMYEVDVLKKLEELFHVHDMVFMVGGSGMYINAVCNGIDYLPNIDQNVRTEMAELFRIKGLETIQEKLKELDPVSYAKIDLNNHFRVLKALEVSVQTGKPYSSYLTDTKRERPFNMVRIGLDMERETLYNRINDRVLLMMKKGLKEEVKGLVHLRDYNAMKTVGYREIFKHLDGELSEGEAIDLIQRNSRKYARKQLTWFRKDQLYPWFHPNNIDDMINHILNRTGIN